LGVGVKIPNGIVEAGRATDFGKVMDGKIGKSVRGWWGIGCGHRRASGQDVNTGTEGKELEKSPALDGLAGPDSTTKAQRVPPFNTSEARAGVLEPSLNAVAVSPWSDGSTVVEPRGKLLVESILLINSANQLFVLPVEDAPGGLAASDEQTARLEDSHHLANAAGQVVEMVQDRTAKYDIKRP
jgi:hypothetical protein